MAPEVFYKKDHPVLYSDWVSGDPLESWTLHIPLKKRHVFLTDFAEFLLQIWTTPPPGHLTEQDQHYSAWLTRSLDRGLRRTLLGTARWGDAIDYLIMRSMIPAYSAEVEVDHYTGLGLAHGDLNAGNIMKDNEFHLTGVIDWDWMYAAPLPAVINHPWFIADIPGWNNFGVEDGETFENDRIFLENAIKQKETERQMSCTVSMLLRDSGKRFFFQSAFHYQGIHEEFVGMHCTRTEDNMRAAASQLDIVLDLYPDLVGIEGVQRAMDLIRKSSTAGN
ncbi:hypothetical protein N7454_007655 [Penicillium verhagenii]|nr:hypothetical protein N7454_007655 [Penicillium verhagenii]